jgi:hypothetical protein
MRPPAASHSPLSKETEELDPFPQPTAHDDGVADHGPEHRHHLSGAKVEPAVEILDRAEDLGLSEAGVVECGDLDPVGVDQLTRVELKPALLLGLAVQLRPGIRSGQRNLDRVRLDLARVAHGLLDRLWRLAREPENERPVDRDALGPRVSRELAGNVEPNALLDVVEDLLVARLVATRRRRNPLSRRISSVRLGTFALALHDHVSPRRPSRRAMSSARGRSSVNVSSSKKNSLTCGNRVRALAISASTFAALRTR